MNGAKQHTKLDDDIRLSIREGFFNLRGLPIAKAAGFLQIARNCLYMSQTLYASTLLYLASSDIGCVENDEILQECDERVWGILSPSTFVFTLKVAVRLSSLVFFPVIGAAIDASSERKRVFLYVCLLTLSIFAVELFTARQAWVLFVLLDSLTDAVILMLDNCFYAYFVELRKGATTRLVAKLSSTVWSLGYLSQFLFIVVMTALAFTFGLDAVEAGRAARLVALVWAGVPFCLAYKWYPHVRALRVPRPYTSMRDRWTECMYHVERVVRTVQHEYQSGLKWFYLATLFANAEINGAVVVTPVFLTDFFGFDTAQVGLVLVAVTISMFFGSRFSSYFTKRTDPVRSWTFSIACATTALLVGLFTFRQRETPFLFVFAWSLMVGFPIGWYYAGKLACFATIAPSGHSMELSGLMILCELGLTWVPLIIFNLLVLIDVPHNWALLTLCIFGMVGVGFISNAEEWKMIRQERNKPMFPDERRERKVRQSGQEAPPTEKEDPASVAHGDEVFSETAFESFTHTNINLVL